MRKSLVICVLGILLINTCPASAEMIVSGISGKTLSADISVSPDMDENFASVAVMPYNSDESNIKIENDTIKNTFYITKETDENGKLNMTFSLPDDFENGQYCVISYDNGKKFISRIGIADESFDGDLVSVNASNSVSEMKNAIDGFSSFNIDDSIFSAHKDSICSYVFDRKPSEGYTRESFIKEYFIAEALSRYIDKEVSFYEFLTEYCAYWSIDYKNTFGTLSDKGFDEAGKLFAAKADGIDGDIDKVLLDIFKIAEIKACKSADELSATYLENAVLRNVDLTKYNLLSDYDKESLFLEMLSKISEADTIEKIDNVFLSIAERLSSPAQNETSGGGSSNKVSSGVSINAQIPNLEIPKTEFSDVAGHWAQEFIKTLSDMGVINGFDDKTFKPDNTITRAEFTKIACKMFNISGNVSCSFSDVKTSDWYYESVCSAYSAGIVSGYDNLFYPNGFITREDAAVIVNRILKLKSSEKVLFKDADDISDYSINAVGALAENGILSGYSDNTFKPKGYITRAEVTALIIRASKINTNK
ncbi:MAG: S-layer homology domain-containing protein [Oscillospiraceae bacterium]|nr:S-layer homology domain-containing protein [Oscillospiraceae bacterium]